MLGETIGAVINAGASLWNNAQNTKNQKQFAQNALQWKAADAEKAGISKIFAMGAPAVSYAPNSVGNVDFTGAGRAVDRAISGQGGPGATTTGKVSGISSAIQQTQLDGLKLDNDIKRAELASKVSVATQPGAGHVMDRDVVQGPAGIKFENKIDPAGFGGNKTFGVSPEVSMYRTKEGYAPQIPQNLQEAFESDALSRWQWNLRNKILPYMDMGAYGTPPHAPDSGSYWTYDPVFGQYVHVPRGGSKTGTRSHKWEYMMDRLRR